MDRAHVGWLGSSVGARLGALSMAGSSDFAVFQRAQCAGIEARADGPLWLLRFGVVRFGAVFLGFLAVVSGVVLWFWCWLLGVFHLCVDGLNLVCIIRRSRCSAAVCRGFGRLVQAVFSRGSARNNSPDVLTGWSGGFIIPLLRCPGSDAL